MANSSRGSSSWGERRRSERDSKSDNIGFEAFGLGMMEDEVEINSERIDLAVVPVEKGRKDE